MKTMLATLTALAFSLPVVAKAQSLSPDASPADSAQLIFALVNTNRAGISSEELKNGQYPIGRSEPDTSHSNVGPHAIHALVGTVTGTLGGAVLGAAIGYYIDTHNCGGATVPATYFLGVLGGIGGAAVGLVVGAFWPTK